MHEGAALARSPKGFDPKHPAAELIRKRNWFYWTEPDIKLATSPKLASEIVRHFRAVAPVMELLNVPLVRKSRATSL